MSYLLSEDALSSALACILQSVNEQGLTMLSSMEAHTSGSTPPRHDRQPPTPDALHLAFKTCARIADELAANIQQAKNRDTHIQRLPTEIFTSILLHCTGGERNLDQVMAFRQVCRQWAHIILNCALFWTVIDIRHQSRAISTCLSRSGDASLDVWFWNCEDQSSAFLNLVVPHARRVRSIHYSGSQPLLARQLAIFASEVHVHLKVPVFNPGPLSLFELTNPFLVRSLALQNACLNWASVNLGNLTRLDLDSIRWGGPTYSQLVKIITGSPLLQSLSLMSMWNFGPQLEDDSNQVFPMTITSEDNRHAPVRLRWLSDVKIARLSNAAFAAVATAFVPAAECRVSLWNTDVPMALNMLCSALAERCAEVHDISVSIVRLAYLNRQPFNTNGLEFQMQGVQEVRVDIQLCAWDWGAGIKALADVFEGLPAASTLSLTLSEEGDAPFFLTAEIISIQSLCKLRNLEEITFTEKVDPTRILGVLGRRISAQDGVEEVPCPALKRLYIRDWQESYLLSFNSFLRRRWADPALVRPPNRLEGWDSRWSSPTFEELMQQLQNEASSSKTSNFAEDDVITDLAGLFE